MEQIVLTERDITALFPNREPETHKGDYGEILLLCGSVGYTGAAALAAKSALRCGTGLVYLGVPKDIYAIEAAKLEEPVVFPLKSYKGQFAPSAVREILRRMEGMDAVLIGPGIGKEKGSFCAVKTVLENFRGPVVVDADGINVLNGHKDILRGRTCPTILTPHPGEFSRFWGNVGNDRVAAAAVAAQETGCIIVLKGHRTVITDGKTCYINHTGNPGMAVGGSGDVLAGVIAGLIGQGVAPLLAAAAGVWLHGAAGDLCSKELGQQGMLPSDMIEALPRLLK